MQAPWDRSQHTQPSMPCALATACRDPSIRGHGPPRSWLPTTIRAIAVLSKQHRLAAAEVREQRGVYSRHGLVYRSYVCIPSPGLRGAW